MNAQRQHLMALGSQLLVFKQQHSALGAQIEAMEAEVRAAFQELPKEEEAPAVAPAKQRYINDFKP